MVIALVKCAMLWLNDFPPINGVLKPLSPSNIIEGKHKIDMNHKRMVYGSYALVYLDTKNNMTARSVPGIVLNPSNMHGGRYFMPLYT